MTCVNIFEPLVLLEWTMLGQDLVVPGYMYFCRFKSWILRFFSSLRKQISVAGTDLLERREADEHSGVPEAEGTGRNSPRGRSEDVAHQSRF